MLETTYPQRRPLHHFPLVRAREWGQGVRTQTVSLEAIVDGLDAAAAVLDDPRLKGRIAALQDHRRAAQLRILVVGTTGSGRSSVVNAMLGRGDLLPVSLTPKASVPLTLSYAPLPAVEMEVVDGSRIALPPDELAERLRDPDTADRFRQIDVRAPLEQLGTCSFQIEALERERDDDAWLKT